MEQLTLRMMMRIFTKHMLSFSFALTLPLLSFAGDMGNVRDYKRWSFPIQIGVAGISQGSNQDIRINGLDGNQYTKTNNAQIIGLGGLGLYYNSVPSQYMQFAYGVNAFYLGKSSVTGDVVQEHLFNNLAYKYDVQNLPVYAAVKALFYTNNPSYNVTLDAGIGPNFMKTSGYRETAKVQFITPDNPFSGTRTTNFSATAGVGLRLNNLLGQFPFECGYRFFYLGKGHLKSVNDQYLDNLATGNVYANALMCSLTI